MVSLSEGRNMKNTEKCISTTHPLLKSILKRLLKKSSSWKKSINHDLQEKHDNRLNPFRVVRGWIKGKSVSERNENKPGYKKTNVGWIPRTWDSYRIQDAINDGALTGHMDGNHGSLYPCHHEFTGRKRGHL